MLLVLSGASGVGKSTARLGVARVLGDAIDAVELGHLGPIPPVPTRAWRQEMVEVAVQRAISVADEGRHLLLAGDPVPAGEALAAPSADMIDVAICLLDANAAAHTARLRQRHEPEELIPHHLAFADWMRQHAVDPSYLPEVLTQESWKAMCWERWIGLRNGEPRWAMAVIDTSTLAPDAVAGRVAEWCRQALAGMAPVFRAGWWHAPMG